MPRVIRGSVSVAPRTVTAVPVDVVGLRNMVSIAKKGELKVSSPGVPNTVGVCGSIVVDADDGQKAMALDPETRSPFVPVRTRPTEGLVK